MILHAGLIARWSPAGQAFRGVLIMGPSGAGKSDLALRAIGQGFRLIADDRVVVFLSGGAPFGHAPSPLRDRIEARGIGVVDQLSHHCAAINLIVRCESEPGAEPRGDQAPSQSLLGVEVPVIHIWPFGDSAIAKICRATEHLGVWA